MYLKVPESHDEHVGSQKYLEGLKLLVLLGSLTLVTFLVLLDTSIIGTAIPRITSDFHSLPDVGWYLGAYMLTAAAFQPLSGKFYAYFDNKVVYLGFVFIFEVGSLVCGVASTSVAFIVGRAIAGFGASGLFNGALTMLSGAVPLEKNPLYTGLLLGMAQIGIVAGPLLGGVLTEHATWRWCFYMNLPIGGVAALVLVFIRVPEVNAKSAFSYDLLQKVIPELDLFGFILFAPAAAMILLALQFGSGNEYSWNSSTVIGLFVGAGISSILFFLWERRMGDMALIPTFMLTKRVVWTSCTFGMCIMSCMITASNWIPTYFQAVKGEEPLMSGVHILPSILGQLLMVVVSGAAVSKWGYYLPWAMFSGIVTAVGNGLISTFTVSTTVGQWVGYQIVVGAGRGAGTQMGLIAIQNAIHSRHIPVAIALLIFAQYLGTSIIIVISNTIFAQTLTAAISKYAPSVSPQAALDAGSDANAVRHLVIGHEEDLSGVLRAYSESLRNVFYFLVGIAALAVLVSVGMGWKGVRTTKVESHESQGDFVQAESVESRKESKV
ncbi:efflux pump protein [Pyrenochaeta sp. MPI-SDFR-AT-0127]|nr:efflux pump protein [Pyrenochaeta sp. MPI-SDFR-AT-0127]